jgi:hypothetical protein
MRRLVNMHRPRNNQEIKTAFANVGFEEESPPSDCGRDAPIDGHARMSATAALLPLSHQAATDRRGSICDL